MDDNGLLLIFISTKLTIELFPENDCDESDDSIFILLCSDAEDDDDEDDDDDDDTDKRRCFMIDLQKNDMTEGRLETNEDQLDIMIAVDF